MGGSFEGLLEMLGEDLALQKIASLLLPPKTQMNAAYELMEIEVADCLASSSSEADEPAGSS